jgi:hypothetical protein
LRGLEPLSVGCSPGPAYEVYDDQQPMMYATVKTDDGAYVVGEIVNVSMGVKLTEFKKKSGYGCYDLLNWQPRESGCASPSGSRTADISNTATNGSSISRSSRKQKGQMRGLV